MGERNYSITMDGVAVHVTRKRIKNFHLKVYRDDGRVVVSAPMSMGEEMIRAAVVGRLDWIHRQRKRLGGQVRQSPVGFVTGEMHYFQGRQYELNVLEHKAVPSLRRVDDAVLEMRVRPGTDASRRRAVLEHWYRRHLEQEIPWLIESWQPILEVGVAEWRIKRMKTRWGTCNPVARRIWLNLELAKKPPECLEYVTVHEMVHLLERRHSARFHGYMDRFLPDWRARRQRLHEAV